MVVESEDFPKKHAQQQATGLELVKIYVGVCEYKYLGKNLGNTEVQVLIGELVGRPLKKIPSFVDDFRANAVDPVTTEVRRVADLKREILLPQIDDVWRNPPPLQLTKKERPSLDGKPLPDDALCLIYASRYWLLDSANQRFEDVAIEGMIHHRLKVKRRSHVPSVKLFRDPTHKLIIKVAIFASRCKDHWVQLCISLFAEYGLPGAHEPGLAS